MMTELQAVNRMLAAVGEPPVSSLTDVAIPEVEQAKNTLTLVVMDVLSRDWSFNSDSNYPLPPDSMGVITAPSNALRVDATAPHNDVQVRSGKLYDRRNQTFIFTEPVLADVSWKLPFAELPYPAQAYITIKAARQFQREYLGSNSMDRMTEQEEAEAYISLVDYDGAGADYNLLENNPEIQLALMRE